MSEANSIPTLITRGRELLAAANPAGWGEGLHPAKEWEELERFAVHALPDLLAEIERAQSESEFWWTQSGIYQHELDALRAENLALRRVADAAHEIAYVLLVGKAYESAILDLRAALAALPAQQVPTPRTEEPK